jgi:hypothetical protein
MQHQQQQQQSGYELLATVGGNGVCQIWQVEPNQQQLVAKLEPPKGVYCVVLMSSGGIVSCLVFAILCRTSIC